MLRALAVLAVLNEVYPVRNRAGRSPSVICLGDPMTCIDYSSHPVAVGGLAWLIIDFGENLPLGGKLRKALSEGGNTERNHRVALHLAAAYEWVSQGGPRRPPALSRVMTVGTQLRQAEFRQAVEYTSGVIQSACLRDFEVASSAHDVLSAHHDRGFEDLDLRPSATFKHSMMPLVVLELNLDSDPRHSRALVSSDTPDFSIDKFMVLGVWNNHTRLLLPSAETSPSARTTWCETIDTVVYKGWGGWTPSSIADATRAHLALTPCITCAQLVRVPLDETTRYSGLCENWWGRWNPCSRSTAPSPPVSVDSWKGFPATPVGDSTYIGRCTLSPSAAASMGFDLLPDFRHMWRPIGPFREAVTHYTDSTSDTLNRVELCNLASNGGPDGSPMWWAVSGDAGIPRG